MGYGRTGYRRNHRGTVSTGRIARPNTRPGPCRGCGEEIPAGAGHLWREADGAWSVVHEELRWAGSPVSGQYVGGCPAETDQVNRDGKFGGPDGARPERDRIAAIAATYAATAPEPRAPRRSYARTSGSARMYERCTHEDYPCCGCGE